jgi:hypothetical protein
MISSISWVGVQRINEAPTLLDRLKRVGSSIVALKPQVRRFMTVPAQPKPKVRKRGLLFEATI